MRRLIAHHLDVERADRRITAYAVQRLRSDRRRPQASSPSDSFTPFATINAVHTQTQLGLALTLGQASTTSVWITDNTVLDLAHPIRVGRLRLMAGAPSDPSMGPRIPGRILAGCSTLVAKRSPHSSPSTPAALRATGSHSPAGRGRRHGPTEPAGRSWWSASVVNVPGTKPTGWPWPSADRTCRYRRSGR